MKIEWSATSTRSTTSHSSCASAPETDGLRPSRSGSAKRSRNFDAPGVDPWRAAARWCLPRMLTPKLPVSSIARALAVSEQSDTRIVGGSADTDAKALTVTPHGRSSIRVVTITTPPARTLIASVKSEGGAAVGNDPVVCVRSWGMGVSSAHRPVTAQSAATGPQSLVRRHVHRDGDAVRHHVEHGRALVRARDDLAQLLVGRVALDAEGDANLLEAVAVVVREPEGSLYVHVALERRLDLGQVHAPGGGDVDERGGEAGGERMQQVLRRVGPGVLPSRIAGSPASITKSAVRDVSSWLAA